MSIWEPSIGASDEWYTPKYIFDAMGARFTLDVAAPEGGAPHVPAIDHITKAQNGLEMPWEGFVWMNPPFGGRNGLVPWLDRFFAHGDGIALTTDRTSAPWWQDAARRSDLILFTAGKVKFERPDGSIGNAPGNGTTLFAVGDCAIWALHRAAVNGLGFLCTGHR